jgi:tripartite-type tricarboxylate transporter receptor subunit TctC
VTAIESMTGLLLQSATGAKWTLVSTPAVAATTSSWRKYVADNEVEDVFLRGTALAPYIEEQTVLMRHVLREAGVQ